MKTFLIFASLIWIMAWNSCQVRAEYVLPYPSFMPGNKLYKISKIVDYLKRFWYWGSIASIKYNLGLSDKYLVEAKILFEYKQYALALNSLKQSDYYVQQLPWFISKSKNEMKDTALLQTTVVNAMLTHTAVIATLKNELPTDFLWQPEKQERSLLPIGLSLDQALQIRKRVRESQHPW